MVADERARGDERQRKKRERERAEKGRKKRIEEKKKKKYTTNPESQSAGVTMHDIIQYPSNTY